MGRGRGRAGWSVPLNSGRSHQMAKRPRAGIENSNRAQPTSTGPQFFSLMSTRPDNNKASGHNKKVNNRDKEVDQDIIAQQRQQLLQRGQPTVRMAQLLNHCDLPCPAPFLPCPALCSCCCCCCNG